LTLREYATTGGVTLQLDSGAYVNAPFDEWYCRSPETRLDYNAGSDSFSATHNGVTMPVSVLPLPGYLNTRDDRGRLVTDVAMSHADRLRLSPIDGCALDCQFCDMAGKRYVKRPAEQLLAAMAIALEDTRLPVSHILISGGTPIASDYPYLDEICAAVATSTALPVDVMAVPRSDTSWIDRLNAAGISGFAINLELYGDAAARYTRRKRGSDLDTFDANLRRAVESTGGGGRVRSLLVAGLEPIEDTVRGVEFIARTGADPVLSPFRPAPGTPLADTSPPSADFLWRLYSEAREIVERHGVMLGPRCTPCGHNTLTFAEGDGYYHSVDLVRLGSGH
jgi:uncharacterized radical SAM superfamily protein